MIEMARIESLLRKEIGLDAASIGASQIQRTVRLRMKSAGLKRFEDYFRLLETSANELDELIEAVVVTETWFFRDREPFAAFTQLALDWLARQPGGTLRVLSVPCSSGEEPYSLAMTLLDAQVPPHQFAIDGVDISSRALARAQLGVYGKNSFRGNPHLYRDRHFQTHKDGWVLKPRARASVRFQHGNVLGDEFLAGRAPYDFIFCRNLLIYFDRATQEAALKKLHHLLTPSGVLFVGPAELPLVTGCGYVNANIPMAFACRPASGGARVPASQPVSSLANDTPSPASNLHTADAARSSPPATHPTASRPVETRAIERTPSQLEVARQLADGGKLVEAVAICENHLRQEGPSAEAYYLLGLVGDAAGDARAVEFYRKALYLEPDHHEALLHLALLLEKNGDPDSCAAARKYKRRAERVSKASGDLPRQSEPGTSGVPLHRTGIANEE